MVALRLPAALLALAMLMMMYGCSNTQYPHLQGFLNDYLLEYTVTEQSPPAVENWLNQYISEPGVFFYFAEDGMYVMATYDSETLVNLEVENIKVENDEITIYFVGTEPVDPVSTKNHYAGVFFVENLQNKGRKVSIVRLAEK